MSPHMAVLACAITELAMDEPEGLVGGVLRYMDDVFGIYAVQTDEEECAVRGWFQKVENGYPPPLHLNVERESDTVRFLELVVTVKGPELHCSLFNKVADDLLLGKPVRQRLPEIDGGTTLVAKRAIVLSAVHRAKDGSLGAEDLLASVLRLSLELAEAGWPQKWLLYAMKKALESEHVMNDALWAAYMVMRSALGL